MRVLDLEVVGVSSSPAESDLNSAMEIMKRGVRWARECARNARVDYVLGFEINFEAVILARRQGRTEDWSAIDRGGRRHCKVDKK